MTRNLYGSFQRLKDFPLDESCRFEKYSDALLYSKRNKLAYPGQMISVYNDDEKATGGENKNGIYIVIMDDNSKTLLRATDTDAIDALNNGLRALKSDFDELSEQLGEDIENRLSTFATQDALDQVDQRITDLIGLGENGSLDETLDTIKEISDWISEHEAFVETILDINSRINLIKAQNDTINGKLNRIDTSIDSINANINAINRAGYISRNDVIELIKNTNYGYKELSFSDITSQKFDIPTGVKIEKISVRIDRGTDDAVFKIFIKNNNLNTVYISNDELLNCNLIDIYEDGNTFIYYLGAPILNDEELWFDISYGLNHDQAKNLRGMIGVSFYNLL